MKKTNLLVFGIIFAVIHLLPACFAFSGESVSYKTTGNIALGLFEEQSNANYKTKAVMVNQPIGTYSNSNYELHLGPYYLFGVGALELFYLNLVPSWNLISIPLIPSDDSINNIMSDCSYNSIWRFNPDQSWSSTDTDLTNFNIYSGFWIDRSGFSDNCSITIKGKLPGSTTINITGGWTLVGFPSLASKPISTFINSSLYNRIWEFQQDQSWINIDTGLTNMTPGRGYWIDGNEGSYDVVN